MAVLQIVPIAANPADPNVITATLPGTTTTVQMGATGLPNVSIGVPVTLKGDTTDPKGPAKTYAWTLTKPSASKADLNKKDAQIVKFTPDVPGMYKVDLVVGNDAGKSKMEAVQIRAGTYIGAEAGNCKSCHTAEGNEWPETGHAVIFKEQIDGGADPKTSHYGEGCLRCHTTGYYVGVQNGGFADVQAKTGWKFPSLASIQSGKGNWDAVPAELKVMGNIQCENCHGPAKEHVANKAPMAASLSAGVCNVCHNGGGHHVKGEMFKNAKHGEETSQAWTYPTGPDRQACVRCHSGAGYISFMKNPTEPATWDNKAEPLTCAGCHDPHSDANKNQLRVVGKPVQANGITKDFALSATCVECHNGRVQPADAQKGSFPHYSAAGEMLSGTGGVDYGQKIADSPHGMMVGAGPIKDPSDKEGKAMLFGGNTPGPCVACHMWPTPPDKDPNQYKVGDHSFNMVSPDGKFQYTAACQSCHPGLKDFNLMAKADYDGNGKVEPVQTEVAGLLTVLQKAIGDSGVKPVKGHPYFDQADVAKANEKQKNAIYNYLFVRGLEGSDGKASAIHNFKRSVMLLQLSYKDLTGKDVPSATLMK
ncbi:MAG: hypothetical protein M1531_05000 [Chloroflexi bacterium]|nr:hypothetical protein [Chloroflexota bacterium]